MNKKKVPRKVRQVWESNVEQDYENNLHISYSTLGLYSKCPKQWHQLNISKKIPNPPTIHTTFGTAIHTTIQTWLTELYYGTVKSAMAMDLNRLLLDNMRSEFIKNRKEFGNYVKQSELELFYLDGIHILDYLKKKRGAYFKSRKVYLAGVEKRLYRELKPGVYFKGYIDLVFYDERDDTWLLLDIKTSTKGWNKYQKQDNIIKSQLILYRKYFSEQYDIPLEKISIKYFIVKRRIPVDAEFPAMARRVQEFVPVHGKLKTKQAVELLEKFVNEAVTSTGKFIQEEPEPTPSEDSCKFCYLKQNRKCPQAIL